MIDLAIMHVYPRFVSVEQAMSTMNDFHMNYSWLAVLVSISLIVFGYKRTHDDLFTLIQTLKDSENRLEQAVIQRTTALTAANAELDAFAYSVSHDLRAPLRSMDGFSQAVLEDYADKFDAEGRDYLERIRRSSQNMAQLIDGRGRHGRRRWCRARSCRRVPPCRALASRRGRRPTTR